MWLWILSAFFLIIVWTAWFFLQPPEGSPETEFFPTWVAITITAVVVFLLIALVVYRRVRARRAARALEKAIAQQAQEQVLAAKPENRAEIQELHRQMLDGIKALKSSRLSEGVTGENALYAMPWYAIVGPPGAGKTTALRHSGLSFPYLDSSGGGVRGVGGTRNCDWWFTNEAILLDTAGRYTTEEADHDEWMAFLDMLLNYRKHKPLNGVIVAVSVSDLIDASEDEIEQMADRVRDRIDEMQQNLKMILPVYVMFSKCDLVAGFVEFFGSMKRSERGQAWGATLPLSMDKADPAAIFEREFDLLVEKLHERTIQRMGSDRERRRDKERIYQFPLEFAAIKRNLADFLAAAFRPSPPPANKRATHIPTPIWRGFYFTSGTQEGKPLDRVVGAMGRAFGLRPAEEEEVAGAEVKSYFLRDVFQTVVFPDQDIAARTADEIKRVRLQRVLVAAAAIVVSMLLMLPAINSYRLNQELIAETQKLANDAAEIDWSDDKIPPAQKLDDLDPLRNHLDKLYVWEQEDEVPISMLWGMYQGDRMFEVALDEYVRILRDGCINPVKARLEDRLRKATGAEYVEDYVALKTYLLLDDKVHLLGEENLNWQKGRVTQEWATVLRKNTSLTEADLRDKILTHVSFYVDLRSRGLVPGEELNANLIAQVRDRLSQVGDRQRYYKQFVDALEIEKIDPTGGDDQDNMTFPSITLNTLFTDRSDVLGKVSSKQKNRAGTWKQIRGPYTAKGHEKVAASLKDGYSILEREQWVVPISRDEKGQAAKIQQTLRRVREDYDNQYIIEWTEFFRDIDVEIPTNNIEAIDEFRVLSTPDWPYWRLLRALRDNTQFEEAKKKDAEAALAESGVIEQLKQKARTKASKVLKTDISGIVKGGGGSDGPVYKDPVPEKFKKMVDFAFPAPPKEGEPAPPSQLGGYVGNLEKLAAEMQVIEEGPPNVDTAPVTTLFEESVKDAEKKLLSLDVTGQRLMRDLLMNPLRQSYKAYLASAGGAASGLWEVMVYPTYRDSIKNRYPFNSMAKRDASFEDAVAFYKPKEGVLWGFYGQYLKSFHRKVGFQYVPNTSLGGIPRPTKRYTPFNANLYNCLERSDMITDALFSQGDPKVKFAVNLTTVSPIVSEIIFTLDGQERRYRNEREFNHNFVWPGEEQTGASIRIRGAGGLDEEIKREGPWGLFRLLESGRHKAEEEDDRTFVVEWQMSAPPVVVRMEVRPTRANHPFAAGFFRTTNCPSTIGDSFGPG